jgi:putative glutamine amidotransferase
MQPIIAITTKREVIGQPHITIWEYYIQSVIRAGGIPILIPSLINNDQLRQLASIADGILISGGGDIDPIIFKGQEHNKVYGIDEERDRVELELVKLAATRSIPLLGICRGLQVINIAMGGTLFTDIADQFSKSIKHSNKSFTKIIHDVKVDPGSLLNSIVEQATLKVNSLHHQGINRLGSGLSVSAVAGDGLTEGIENSEKEFFMGVQWHPEAMTEDPAAIALFSSFINAAQKYREQNGR